MTFAELVFFVVVAWAVALVCLAAMTLAVIIAALVEALRRKR